MFEIKVHPVPRSIAERAHINRKQYLEMYRRSVDDSDGFWTEQAEKFVDWHRKWDRVQEWNYTEADIKWFIGARLNVSYNCLDRHLEARGNQTAIIWEGDDPATDRKITYRELHEQVCRFANVLKSHGVRKGDRVSIYMPMIPETAVAMLACARIGAVHSVVFGGFSSEALKDRILDSDCRVVVTADESVRGGRTTSLKANTDQALEKCPGVHTVVVVRRTGAPIPWNANRDVWYHEAVEAAPSRCPPEEVDAEDPLFILYTSGSTGKPKGAVHTSGGYLLFAAMTHKYVFDYHDGEVFWCGADVGWVTGHSYIVYGPLANGATSLIFEGVPTYPDAGRFWQVIDKHRVNIFYTAPTAIRALMGLGDAFVTRSSRKTLRILGTVGEPINPEAWEWYYQVVGGGRCPIVDTWWQTETGGIMITPLPGAIPPKPGSATLPFFGVDPVVVDDEGKELHGNPAKGNLCVRRPWPGQA
ncbi:MAG: acetate--CoA ligase, partial [Gammaproteobacteria bacterium]